jgi:hypothetical protein
MTSTMRFDEWENTLGEKYGTVLQVQNYQYSTTFTTTTVETWISITNFAVTLTPKFITSKMLITVSIGRAAGTNATAWRVLRNGNTFSLPDVDGSRQRAHFLHSNLGVDSNHADGGFSITLSDTPGTLVPVTYQLQFMNEGAGTHSTLFGLNRNSSNTNNSLSYNARTVSTMTVMEIAQ